MAAPKIPLINRFWNKVDQGGPVIYAHLGQCWQWTGNQLIGRGYGLLKHNRHTVRAHRAAWEICHGPIPNGLWVLHKCDNPPCVRPDHLYLGTRMDNTRDALERGKHGDHRGEKGSMAKLINSDIPKIRTLYASGVDQHRIGQMFGVDPSTISNVITGKHWSHIK